MDSPASAGGATPASKGGQITAARVKALLRDDVKSISTEACFAVGRAAELFLEALAGGAAAKMGAAQRATLEYRDVAGAVAEREALDWLADMVPQTVKAAALLPAMQAEEEQKQQQEQRDEEQPRPPAAE